MRMIPLKDVQYNMILGKSIYGFNNKLLLGAGFRLTPPIKKKLIEKGYNYLYIMEEGTEEVVPEDIISDEIRIQAKIKFTDEAEKMESFFKFQDMSRSKVYDLLNKDYLKEINLTYEMRKVVDDILKDISTAGAKFMNSLMLKSKDTYLIDHSINTTVLAILIGQRYRFNKSELSDLALGVFLHDFGKIIIEKLKDSSNPEMAEELLKEHPTFGYLLFKNSQNSSPIVSQVINQHHENQDGTGYPIGLKGQNLPPTSTINRETKGYIFRLAEICSVADAYDNLSMNPEEKKQAPPSEAMKQLVVDAGTKYNKDIVKVLAKIIPHYPVGAFVKITNIIDPSLIGYTSVVSKLNENDLNKPVIILIFDRTKKRIKPRMIDTSKLTKIELELLL